MISTKMIKRIQIRSCYHHMTSVIRCQHSKPDKIVSEEGVKGKKNWILLVKKKIRQIEGRSARLSQNVNKLSQVFSPFLNFEIFKLDSCPKLIGTPGIKPSFWPFLAQKIHIFSNFQYYFVTFMCSWSRLLRSLAPAKIVPICPKTRESSFSNEETRVKVFFPCQCCRSSSS